MYKKLFVNLLTFSRILLSLLFCYYAFTYQSNITAVLVIFLFIFATDYFDGKLARRLSAETKAGAIFDVTVDLFFIVTSYITLIICNELPAWALAVILLKFAEFIITSSIVRKSGKCSPSGLFYDNLGRIAIVIFYALPILAITLKNFLDPLIFDYVINTFIILVTLMAGASSVERVKKCFRVEEKFSNSQ